jgi:hypothetical protein
MSDPVWTQTTQSLILSTSQSFSTRTTPSIPTTDTKPTDADSPVFSDGYFL